MGWMIFKRSLGMVFDNLGAALKVSLLLYLAQVAVGVYFERAFGAAIVAVENGEAATVPAGFWGAWLMFLLVSLGSSLWIAVSWHRYILLRESPGTALPPFHGPQIAAYLTRSIVLGLVLGAVFFVLAMVVGMVGSVLLGGAPTQQLSVAIAVFAMGPVAYLFYRLSPILPAAAVGRPLSLRAAWAATAPLSRPIVILTLIAIGAAIVIQIPTYLNPNAMSLVNLVYSYVLGWVSLMVGLSIMTTLYGHCVEGREI